MNFLIDILILISCIFIPNIQTKEINNGYYSTAGGGLPE